MFAAKNELFTRPSGGYTIARSVRLRSSASAYLNRTFSTPTSSTIWTWSAWVKRGGLTGTYRLFGASTTTYLTFNSSDQLNLTLGGTSAATSTAVYRDPSSWYHIVYQQNGSAQTIYVNNVSVATGTTAAAIFNTAIAHQLGAANTTNYFDGYMAEVNFVDGQALTPSSFGATNSNGVWQPIAYTGTYGTNGFYLKFADNSTAAALGTDSSGNSNTWTVNNINVTAYSGTPADNTSYDSMTDVPTLTSATAANYAVLNAAAPAPGSTSITNGNLSWAQTAATLNRAAIATFGMSSGKWYWECAVGSSIGTNNSLYLGIAQGTFALTTYCGGTADSWGYTSGSGNKITNGSGTAYGATFTSNDVIGFAFDADAGTITAYKNGTTQGTMFTGLTSGPYFAVVSQSIGGGGTTGLIRSMNFGQRPFTSTPPTGFVALNAYNLSTPTIPNGATQTAATLYTGTNATLAIANTVNGTNFQPDFVWIKSRSNITNHALFDSVRGVRNVLSSNTTDAAVLDTAGTSLTSFDSTGFSLGTTSATAGTNVSGQTYVAWQWKANGTGVSNTSGSITSTVSANTTAGFAVVTYTGTGANATVGHGLSTAPVMVIVKCRSNAANWTVGSSYLTSWAYFLQLSSTVAQTLAAAEFNSTAPTSSVFSVGTDTDTNGSARTYVAYVFAAVAGYSAFGSYTGNGSADGPFVFLGFRPRWVMTKRTDTTSNWYIQDTSRSSYNVQKATLFAESSAAEAADGGLDFLSNGFKLRNTDSSENASGGTYIYMAFAENPFKYSLAR